MEKYFRYFIGLGAFCLVSCASPEMAEQAEDTDQVASTEIAEESEESGNNPNEIICRREMVTGSNFRRRVCLTRAQRGEMRTESREEFIERRSGTLGAAPAGSAN